MDITQIIDAVRETLRSQKAEGDLYIEHSRTLRFEMRGGNTEELSRADARGLAVRAFRGGRLGFVHTNKFEVDEATQAARKACELARFGSQRDDLVLAPPITTDKQHDEGMDLGVFDVGLPQRPLAMKQDWLKTAETAAHKFDAKVKRTESASWSETMAVRTIANTNGLQRRCQKTFVEVSLGVVAEENGEMQPGEVSVEAVRWKDLPEPSSFGWRAGERAVRLLGGRPVPTGSYPVVFSPDSGWAFLVYLSAALSGEPLSRGQSWLSDRLKGGGEALASPLVTVKDDGLLKTGPGAVPFDDEGVSTQETVLLEAGKVKGGLCDLASGKRLGVPSTGNCVREGYESLPAIRSHNLYMVPGTAKPDDIVASVDRGLWVWGLSGWWIGLDPSNPRFSSAAFGLWIEKGKPVRPVARVTIAGSLQEILTGIDAVGSDLVWDHATRTPTFRVREISVSGT
jgi:PmbA protein